MSEIETVGAAATTPKRRAARKPRADAESTEKRAGRGKRAAAGPKPDPTGEPESTPRPRSPRTRTRRTPDATHVDTAEPRSEDSGSSGTPPGGPVASGVGEESPLPPASAPAEAAAAVAAPEAVPPAAPPASPEAPQDTLGTPAASPHGTHVPEASTRQQTAVHPLDVRHPVSLTRPARPTFKQRVLDAAEERFRAGRIREPITARQVDELLVLLHQDGHSKSLVDTTYDYMRGGMSKRHAEVQIEKLRGTFVPRDARVAA